MCSESYSRSSFRNSGSAIVAQPAILYCCAQPVGGNATGVQGVKSQLGPSSNGRPSSSPGKVEVNGMQIIRQALQESEVFADSGIVDTVMQSWRSSTQKQYAVYINKWVQFCRERSCDPLRPAVKELLAFLHCMFKKGASYSALNTARSAVSNIDLCKIDHNARCTETIGKHFLVCRFLKGVFNAIKPTPKYNQVWSVDPVLDYLALLWPLDKLTRKELTLKLATLVALTTSQRCQTLSMMDISEKFMHRSKECYSFSLTQHIKQDRPGNVFGNVRLFKYHVKELCVYETLSYYLSVTRDQRASTELFVSYTKPYRAVTPSTIGRWIRTLLGQAGVDTKVFTAHSTRGASTSKAFSSVPVEIILKAAGWSNECTFRKFYNKPVSVEKQMSLAVLEKNVV